uniref:Uncharacterized protein n=1 Tax=Canis lupus familiaris TaxID=9615 RepID=A0A8C0RTJ4_CANLF
SSLYPRGPAQHKNVSLFHGSDSLPPRCHGGPPDVFFFFFFWSALDLISRGFCSLLGCFLSAMSARVAGFASALTLVPVTFSLILLQG